MKVFFIKFKIRPNKENYYYNVIEGALAHCWMLEELPDTALRKATFYVNKDSWEIDSVESYPVEVKREDFQNKDLGLKNIDKAVEEGMAFAYVGWSRDGKSSFGPIELKPSSKFDLEKYLKLIKKNQRRGRCLHFDAGTRCNKISKAHSIQEKGLLNKIQEDGVVYQPNADIGYLKKNRGTISYKKISVKLASTFLGFCNKHDNEIFKPIDTKPLIPTNHQVFLYAYRTLCREFFVKENAVNIVSSQLELGVSQEIVKNFLSDMKLGFENGLKNLRLHKSIYDESIKNNNFDDIRYTLFISTQKPNLVFSGGIFPDFDFLGRQIQDLSNLSENLDMITFCSAPMKLGWGFLFAWHNHSSGVAIEYMRSLATVVYKNSVIEDYLFRLTMNCENHAISPSWWESRSEEDKNKIVNYISSGVNMFANIPYKYLMSGLEGISNWKFDNVLSNY